MRILGGSIKKTIRNSIPDIICQSLLLGVFTREMTNISTLKLHRHVFCTSIYLCILYLIFSRHFPHFPRAMLRWCKWHNRNLGGYGFHHVHFLNNNLFFHLYNTICTGCFSLLAYFKLLQLVVVLSWIGSNVP